MLVIYTNGPSGKATEFSVEDLLKVLETEVLNPTFGVCQFIQDTEHCFWGNFLTKPYPFHLVTDDVNLIQRLSKAIEKNMTTEAYQKAYAEWRKV